MSGFPWLSATIFMPWVGALLLSAWRRPAERAVRLVAFVFSLSTLLLGAALVINRDPVTAGYQFGERHVWIEALCVHYHLGIDGLSLLLVLLTGIVGPIGLLATGPLARDVRLYHVLYLLLQGSALGVFLSLDFVLWFLFWEASLVPAFFLVKLWGGEQAGEAAYRFFIYTVGGSAFLLLGFVIVFAGTGTFSFTALADLARKGDLAAATGSAGTLAFFGLLLGLAVKAPLFPFHGWMPATYAAAPVGVSIFLTAVMSKMGVYGFLRLLWPLFPGELHAAAPLLVFLALAGVVVGAVAALRQKDLRRLLAYSSLNHISYCLLALFAVGRTLGQPGASSEAAGAALGGALVQMFNHGVTAAALFCAIGVLAARGGSYGRDDFGGVRQSMPVFAGIAAIAVFASLGLPGLNGFVGEFLILRGVFGLDRVAAAVACVGLLATAAALLTFYQRVFHGTTTTDTVRFADLDTAERSKFLPLLVLIVGLGVYPQPLLALINPLVASWAGHLVQP